MQIYYFELMRFLSRGKVLSTKIYLHILILSSLYQMHQKRAIISVNGYANARFHLSYDCKNAFINILPHLREVFFLEVEKNIISQEK